MTDPSQPVGAKGKSKGTTDPAAGKPLDLSESVAGEEDPGAAIELPAAAPGPTVQPADRVGSTTGGTPDFSRSGTSKFHHYTAQILWQRDGRDFAGNRYSRRHLMRFDGGAQVTGSSSPHVVPLPYSDPAGVDPEEAFVASLSSCHMLWFLSIAANGGYCVDRYIDNAQGVMARNAAGKMAMTRVTLRPQVVFSGEKRPTREQLEELHHRAHEECFIANSVTTEVRCEPVVARA